METISSIFLPYFQRSARVSSRYLKMLLNGQILFLASLCESLCEDVIFVCTFLVLDNRFRIDAVLIDVVRRANAKISVMIKEKYQ